MPHVLVISDDVSYFSECDKCEKSNVGVFVYLHVVGAYVKGDLDFPPSLICARIGSETTILFDHATLIGKHIGAILPPVRTYIPETLDAPSNFSTPFTLTVLRQSRLSRRDFDSEPARFARFVRDSLPRIAIVTLTRQRRRVVSNETRE